MISCDATYLDVQRCKPGAPSSIKRQGRSTCCNQKGNKAEYEMIAVRLCTNRA
jgi:hypothetical protein